MHRPLILRLCLKSNRHKQSQLPPQMRKLHHIPATGCNTSNTSSVRNQRRGAPNTLLTLSYLAPQFVCPTTEPFETSQSLFEQTCEQLSAQGTRQLHSQPSASATARSILELTVEANSATCASTLSRCIGCILGTADATAALSQMQRLHCWHCRCCGCRCNRCIVCGCIVNQDSHFVHRGFGAFDHPAREQCSDLIPRKHSPTVAITLSDGQSVGILHAPPPIRSPRILIVSSTVAQSGKPTRSSASTNPYIYQRLTGSFAMIRSVPSPAPVACNSLTHCSHLNRFETNTQHCI